MSAERAEFDESDVCVLPGYATYWRRRRGLLRPRLRCWLGHHVLPLEAPTPENGISPSNYVTCPRCLGAMHWFVVGQHRFGSFVARGPSEVHDG